MHDLRHSYASFLVNQGVSLFVGATTPRTQPDAHHAALCASCAQDAVGRHDLVSGDQIGNAYIVTTVIAVELKDGRRSRLARVRQNGAVRSTNRVVLDGFNVLDHAT